MRINAMTQGPRKEYREDPLGGHADIIFTSIFTGQNTLLVVAAVQYVIMLIKFEAGSKAVGQPICSKACCSASNAAPA